MNCRRNRIAPGTFTREHEQHRTDRPPVFAAKLARLQAVQAALQLAENLLLFDADEDAWLVKQAADKLKGQVKEWRRTGRDWFEERYIKKPYYPTEMVRDEHGAVVYRTNAKGAVVWDRYSMPVPKVDYGRAETGEPAVAYHTFGPHYYFRWRNEIGKIQTIYYLEFAQIYALLTFR